MHVHVRSLGGNLILYFSCCFLNLPQIHELASINETHSIHLFILHITHRYIVLMYVRCNYKWRKPESEICFVPHVHVAIHIFLHSQTTRFGYQSFLTTRHYCVAYINFVMFYFFFYFKRHPILCFQNFVFVTLFNTSEHHLNITVIHIVTVSDKETVKDLPGGSVEFQLEQVLSLIISYLKGM